MSEFTSNDIRQNLMSYMGEYESFIDYAPDIYDILCMLLKCNITKDQRQKVCGAITSYIVPNNIFPEELYGPYSYVENIIVGMTVLKEIHMTDIILSEEQYNQLLNAYDKSREVITSEEKQKLLEFYGIREKNQKRLADLFE